MVTEADAQPDGTSTAPLPGADGLSTTIMADARRGEVPTAPPAASTDGLSTTTPVGGRTARSLLERGDYVGRYLVLSRTGQGGMGVVYSAHDPELDRKVALKLLLSEQSPGSEGSTRLLREAQALAKLSHPNVVSVHDVGTLGNRVWIAMEFLEGRTVAAWLKEKRRSWREVLEVFVQAGEGLRAAHAAGFIHRDFKPENVMVTTSGRVKVMDFGLARIDKDESETDVNTIRTSEHQDVALTRTGMLLGTPRYMSPEQWDGASADLRTDQFSFCVSLWEALFGEAPFSGNTLAELAISVKNGQVRPRPAGSPVPTWLSKTVLRGLNPMATQRWTSMGALLDALQNDPTWRNRVLIALSVISVGVSAFVIQMQIDKSRRDTEIAGILEAIASESQELYARLEQAREGRRSAFEHFDRGNTRDGEDLWLTYISSLPGIEQGLARVDQSLERAIRVDGARDDVREQWADMLFQRALLSEEFHLGDAIIQGFLARMRIHDISGERMARWDAPAQLEIRTDPTGSRAFLERYEDDGSGRLKIRRAEELRTTPLISPKLEPGSYRLRFEVRGRIEVLYPILIERGEEKSIDVLLPSKEDVPNGYIYVPSGEFLYGSDDPEDIRSLLGAEPLRKMTTEPFLIGRHEVTFGEFITYLDAISSDERRKVLGRDSGDGWPTVKLIEDPEAGWRIELNQGLRTYKARRGEPLVYEERRERSGVDWTQLPLAGVSSVEASAYLEWLDRTGRLPGARFCTEYEWERASRGADNRRFSHGAVLDPSEANTAPTYGRIPAAMGLDPVGSHPQSESPFGLQDTVGNVFEMVVSPWHRDGVVARGGAFFYEPWVARVVNRQPLALDYRETPFGMRVCASYPLVR